MYSDNEAGPGRDQLGGPANRCVGGMYAQRLTGHTVGIVEEDAFKVLRVSFSKFREGVKVALEASRARTNTLCKYASSLSRILDELAVRARPILEVERWNEMMVARVAHAVPYITGAP